MKIIRHPALMLAAAALTVALVPVAAAYASASPAGLVGAPQLHLTCGEDVCIARPVLRSVPRVPPLTTLMEFQVSVYLSHYPQKFHDNVTLYWWRSAKALHRPKGRWVTIHPTRGWTETDLPPPGHRLTKLRPLTWECEPGRYYSREHAFGISHTGTPDSVNLFFPWKGFVKGHPLKGNDLKPPSLHEAWLTKCQGSDGLQG